MSASLQPPDELSLLVKNPAGAADAQVRVPASATVGDVKRTLSREYSGNPDPSLQTVIYAGRVLKDERVKLTEVAKQALETGSPLSIHLVVKQPAQAAAPQAGVASASRASQATSGSEPNGFSRGPTAGASGQASSTQGNNHHQEQQQRGLNGAAPEWPFHWPEAFPAGMAQFPGEPGTTAGPSPSDAGPSSSGAGPGLGQNGGPHPHMHAMPMHWQQLPGGFPGLPAGFPAGMPQMMPFQHVGPQPVMALSMPPHFPQPFPWAMPMPAMQPQAGPQPVAPTIPNTSTTPPSSSTNSSQPPSSPATSGSSPAAAPSQTSPPPNGLSGTSSLPQAGSSSTGPTTASQHPHPISPPTRLPNMPHLHMGPIPNGAIPGITGQPQGGYSHPAPHLMGFPGLHGQQLVHPTLGPLQMMPVTQMVQVMVPVLMPFPPPQPGQMMVHPGQMMMGQPAGTQAGPRPQPQPAGSGSGEGLRFRRVGNNWLVGLQQNQAQHPQQGQAGWNGVMGNAAAPGPPLQPRIRLVNIRIPVRALVQMAVLGLVLYQHCPPGRFLLLALGGMLFYLAGLTPLRQYLQRLAGLAPPPRPGAAPPHPPAPPPAGAHPPAAGPPGAGAAPQGGPQGGHPPAGGNPAAAGVARVRPAGGLLHELQAFVVGFFTSLLPGWNANAEDAAAFAAAEAAAAAEEAGAGF